MSNDIDNIPVSTEIFSVSTEKKADDEKKSRIKR